MIEMVTDIHNILFLNIFEVFFEILNSGISAVGKK